MSDQPLSEECMHDVPPWVHSRIAKLEAELATALKQIHGEFCGWDGCGHLERIAELEGVKDETD